MRAVGRHRRDEMLSWAQLWLPLAGAALLAGSAGIHLDLYLTGYRSIPTIGWLFLVQFIAGFILAAAALVTRSRLVAAACAVFALSTLTAYLLAVRLGLFGFKEVRTRAGIAAGLIEVAAFAMLALAALITPAPRPPAAGPGPASGCWPGSSPRCRSSSPRSVPYRWPRWPCLASRWPTRA